MLLQSENCCQTNNFFLRLKRNARTHALKVVPAKETLFTTGKKNVVLNVPCAFALCSKELHMAKETRFTPCPTNARVGGFKASLCVCFQIFYRIRSKLCMQVV